MEIKLLLNQLYNTNTNDFTPPGKLPALKKGISLPEDLKQFYQKTGGGILFKDSLFPLTILSPKEFGPRETFFHISDFEKKLNPNWYILATLSQVEYICIDLDPISKGTCYDCFVSDTFGIIGQPIPIADSFTEFLEKLIGHTENYRDRMTQHTNPAIAASNMKLQLCS